MRKLIYYSCTEYFKPLLANVLVVGIYGCVYVYPLKLCVKELELLLHPTAEPIQLDCNVNECVD